MAIIMDDSVMLMLDIYGLGVFNWEEYELKLTKRI